MALELGVRSAMNPSIWLDAALRNMVHPVKNKGPVCFSNGYCLDLLAYWSILFEKSASGGVPPMSTVRRLVCAAVLLAVAGARHGHAQVLYGSLTGNVTDPANASVPGVH